MIALVLSVILLYEEIVVERGNPLVLSILTGLLAVVILEYYLSRRRNLDWSCFRRGARKNHQALY